MVRIKQITFKNCCNFVRVHLELKKNKNYHDGVILDFAIIFLQQMNQLMHNGVKTYLPSQLNYIYIGLFYKISKISHTTKAPSHLKLYRHSFYNAVLLYRGILSTAFLPKTALSNAVFSEPKKNCKKNSFGQNNFSTFFLIT